MHDGFVRTLYRLFSCSRTQEKSDLARCVRLERFKYTSEEGDSSCFRKGGFGGLKATKGNSSLYTLQGEKITSVVLLFRVQRSNSDLNIVVAYASWTYEPDERSTELHPYSPGPCTSLSPGGVRFLRTHENNLKLEGPGTSGSGSQNRARALEVTVAGIIFSLALTESISSKGMTSALIWQVSSGSSESGNATSLPALESSSSSESLATRDYYNLPPQNNPGEYEGLVRDHLDQALNVPHYRNILDMEYFELTVLERKGLLQDRLFNLMLGEQNLSRIMELSPYTNIRREAYDFLEAPVLLKWFVSRDVPTGAPSSNGTIIPIPIPSFPLLVYLHSRKFIRSTDGAKSGVLVRASRPILLPDIIGRSSSETRARKALFRFVPVLHFLLIEKKGDFSYLESFCGVLRLLFFRTFFSLPRDRSAKRERARRRKGQPNGNEQGRNDKMRSDLI
ncbi:hypothetical protein Tco_0965581 [Tanacetum coccineum]